MARTKLLLPLFLILLAALLVAACGASANVPGGKPAAAAALPAGVQSAPQRVREAYQFAIANPSALKNVPCYCGCGAVGHDSNYACYIKGANADGSLAFDDHALGCSICVDITLDVQRFTAQGKSPADIRAVVNATYSQFGPSNQP